MRFPFNSYENENWDIEHIRSQTDRTISGKQRVLWAKDVLEYITGKQDVREQKKVIKKELKSKTKKIAKGCLLYTSPSPRDQRGSRMPSSA